MKIVQKKIEFIAPEISETIRFSFVLDWRGQDGDLYANGGSCATLALNDNGVWEVRNHASDTEDRYLSPVIETLPKDHEFPDIYSKAIHALATYRDHGWQRENFDDENLTKLPAFGAEGS